MAAPRDKFKCPVCGTEVLTTKASDTTPECCGQPMEIQRPKELAVAD